METVEPCARSVVAISRPTANRKAVSLILMNRNNDFEIDGHVEEIEGSSKLDCRPTCLCTQLTRRWPETGSRELTQVCVDAEETLHKRPHNPEAIAFERDYREALRGIVPQTPRR